MTLALRLEPIRVRLESSRPCLGAHCTVPAVAHVVWITSDGGHLVCVEACAGHLAVARDLGGCLTFPLDQVPGNLVDLVRAEIARRYRPRQQYWPGFAFGTTTANVTFTFNA